jgi:hypothetical protein
MRSSRLYCLSLIKTLMAENTHCQATPEAKAIRAAALETMRRIFASMSEKAFKVHLEGYDEDHLTPHKFIKTIFIAAILLVSIQTAQTQINYLNPINAATVRAFDGASCDCFARDTATISKFPAFHRSKFVSSAFNNAGMGFIPFEIYFAHERGGQLYLLNRGACRNVSTTIPLPEPGWYFVRFFSDAQPALIEINACRKEEIVINSYGKCKLKLKKGT